MRRLLLSRVHERLRLQWARERHHWRFEWRYIVFSDETRFNMSYTDGRICVRLYAGERNLRACILQRHRGPAPSVMVWDAIGYNMRHRILCTEGNLNSDRYIIEVLQPKVLPLLQAIPHAIFQQDNARPRTPSGYFTCHISAGQCPVTRGKDCASFLPNTTGITASLACTFARHVAHRTCLGYCWSATDSSGSSNIYSRRFVNSHTNCVEEQSPGRYPGPL